MLVYVDQIRQLVNVLAVQGNTVYCSYDMKDGTIQYCEYNIVLGTWKVSEPSPSNQAIYDNFDYVNVIVSVGVNNTIAKLTGCGLSILKAIVLGRIDKDQIAQELKARGLKDIPEFKIIRYHSGAYRVETLSTNLWSEFLYSLDIDALINQIRL